MRQETESGPRLPCGMPVWMRALIAGASWLAVALAPSEAWDLLAAYALVPIAVAVGVTGAALGLWGGVLAALGAGAGLVIENVGWGGGRDALLAAVLDGALLPPAALLAVGLATGAWRRLVSQLRTHRAASDRAQYDVLTGLLNRSTFERRLHGWMKGGGARGHEFAVLFVDLDRFKFVNDTFGHATGDQLLIAIARVLESNVRDRDLVARLGGDEFVIALNGVKDAAAAGLIAAKLVRLLGTPFEADGRVLTVSASVGVALYPCDGEDVQSLTKSADAAMYAVKTSGKNSYHFSDHDQRHRQARRLGLERQLRNALHDQELQVVYQPQIEMATGRLIGFEALMRWHNRDLGLVSPGEFIPIAEEAGMIVPIGHWLLREVCRQAAAWSTYAIPGFSVAINVSTLQFRQPGFLRQVDEAIRDARVDPSNIELEMTESVLIADFELAVATLRRLDQMGVRTALDDFGTGYSSLAYLQRLPIGSLKIDRSFVSGLVLGPTGLTGNVAPIVDAITALGVKLGKRLVAEGVETEAQASYLQRIGVDRAQGFLYAKPMTVAQAERLLARSAPRPTREAAVPLISGNDRVFVGPMQRHLPRSGGDSVVLVTD